MLLVEKLVVEEFVVFADRVGFREDGFGFVVLEVSEKGCGVIGLLFDKGKDRVGVVGTSEANVSEEARIGNTATKSNSLGSEHRDIVGHPFDRGPVKRLGASNLTEVLGQIFTSLAGDSKRRQVICGRKSGRKGNHVQRNFLIISNDDARGSRLDDRIRHQLHVGSLDIDKVAVRENRSFGEERMVVVEFFAELGVLDYGLHEPFASLCDLCERTILVSFRRLLSISNRA